MKLDAKNLRINSITLIVLTVLSAISLVGRILANQISTAAIMERGNITAERAGIYFAITIFVSCLLYLLTLIIGIRGFSQANGKCDGKANVILGTILLILKLISLAIQVYYVVKGQMEIIPLTRNVIFICFLVPYIMCAKKVK